MIGLCRCRRRRANASAWASARRAFIAAGLVELLVAGAASAQEAPSQSEWTHGTILTAAVGVAADSSRTGVVAGGGFGWEITRRFAIEGSALWLERGPEASAFAADAKALVTLVSPRRVSPFLLGGIGLYTATFDVVDSPIPDFYRQRITTPPGGLGRRESFTDPAILFGGGVNAWLGLHVSIRPEVEVRTVVNDSSAYWLTTFAVRIAYHVEDHPVSSIQ